MKHSQSKNKYKRRMDRYFLEMSVYYLKDIA